MFKPKKTTAKNKTALAQDGRAPSELHQGVPRPMPNIGMDPGQVLVGQHPDQANIERKSYMLGEQGGPTTTRTDKPYKGC